MFIDKNCIILFLFVISFSYALRDIEEEENKKEENILVKPPTFSRISGFYSDDFKLKLYSEENNPIYYTLDSSDPRTSSTSKKFKDYILIYDRSSEENVYSAIGVNNSSPVSIATSKYNPPFYSVDKAMIIRAAAKNAKGNFSEVITKTYFVTTEDLYKYQDQTILSIVTDPENLFDPDIGIYVTGTMYIEALKKEEEERGKGNGGRPNRGGGGFRNNKSNYRMKGKEWEREAFVTIFDKGEIHLQQKMGMRIKGAFTRNEPGKSFNIYARKQYGKSTIDTDLLKDNFDINGNLITSYKSLSLRNVYDEDRIRDKYARDLFYMRKDIGCPSYKETVLFLNGEYWGFYLIQEKIDDNYISSNYLLPTKELAVAKVAQIEDGPEEEIDNFKYFCGNYSTKNVADEEIYSKIKNYIDINSLIELFATGIYISNLDWPGNNDGEWKYLGEPIEGNKYSDGKWRFFMYDVDYSMGVDFFSPGSGAPEANMFEMIGGGSGAGDGNRMMGRRRNSPPLNIFINLLKNNTDFKKKFANVMCDYANSIYLPERINKLIEKYNDECTDLVAYSQMRWSGENYYSKFEGYAYYKTNYLKSLDSLKNFFEERPKYIFQHLKDFTKLEGELVDLTIEIKGRGKVQINSINPTFVGNVWTGKYFTKIPIKIKAINGNGYNFKEWAGIIQSKEENEEIILSCDGQKIIAVFD